MSTTPSSPKLADKLRLLAASMRHSAGQWMVPGWDGHKVADLLSDAQASIQALEADAARYRHVRQLAVRRALPAPSGTVSVAFIAPQDHEWRASNSASDDLDAAIDAARAAQEVKP